MVKQSTLLILGLQQLHVYQKAAFHYTGINALNEYSPQDTAPALISGTPTEQLRL